MTELSHCAVCGLYCRACTVYIERAKPDADPHRDLSRESGCPEEEGQSR